VSGVPSQGKMNIGYEISFCIDFGAKTNFKPCHFPNSM